MEAVVCQLQSCRDSSFHHRPSPWWCHKLKGHETKTVISSLFPHYAQANRDGSVQPWVDTNVRTTDMQSLGSAGENGNIVWADTQQSYATVSVYARVRACV